MIKILFVCHGNICRSPMAEFVMKHMVKEARLESQFHIESAATSREELGNPVYPPARKKLSEHGIDCTGKTARQLRSRESAEETQMEKYICFWTTPAGRVMLPTPGIPGTLTPHGEMWQRAVRVY